MIERKLCSLCKEEKLLTEFDKNKTKPLGVHSRCKLCRRSDSKKYYEQNQDAQKKRVKLVNKISRRKVREYIWNYLLTHPCASCGETDPVVLEFDHVGAKKDCVSTMIRNRVSISKIELEIQNCQVLCANCHKKKTAKDQNWYKYLTGRNSFQSSLISSTPRCATPASVSALKIV